MPEEMQQTEVETTKIISGGTTGFSLKNPTPLWATWVFRTQFIMNKMGLFYLTGTDRVQGADLKEIILIMGVIDLGTWMLANSIGVKKKDLGLPDED